MALCHDKCTKTKFCFIGLSNKQRCALLLLVFGLSDLHADLHLSGEVPICSAGNYQQHPYSQLHIQLLRPTLGVCASTKA